MSVQEIRWVFAINAHCKPAKNCPCLVRPGKSILIDNDVNSRSFEWNDEIEFAVWRSYRPVKFYPIQRRFGRVRRYAKGFAGFAGGDVILKKRREPVDLIIGMSLPSHFHKQKLSFFNSLRYRNLGIPNDRSADRLPFGAAGALDLHQTVRAAPGGLLFLKPRS